MFLAMLHSFTYPNELGHRGEKQVHIFLFPCFIKVPWLPNACSYEECNSKSIYTNKSTVLWVGIAGRSLKGNFSLWIIKNKFTFILISQPFSITILPNYGQRWVKIKNKGFSLVEVDDIFTHTWLYFCTDHATVIQNMLLRLPSGWNSYI